MKLYIDYLSILKFFINLLNLWKLLDSLENIYIYGFLLIVRAIFFKFSKYF